MKDKVIETAGKVWKTLGQNGDVNIAGIAKLLREKDSLVFQALGWLAREDKISYSTKGRQTFVSLVESEKQAFQSAFPKTDAVKAVPKLETEDIRNRVKKYIKKV